MQDRVHGSAVSWELDTEAEANDDQTTLHSSRRLLAFSLIVVVTSAALLLRGTAPGNPTLRLDDLRNEVMQLISGGLDLSVMHSRAWSGHHVEHRVSVPVSNVYRDLAKDENAPSQYKYVYQSGLVEAGPMTLLCEAVNTGTTTFDLEFMNGPLKMGSKTANITEASLCASKLATNGSVSFSFHHEETGRHIVDSVVMGQIMCTPAPAVQSTCSLNASALLDHGMGPLPDGQAPPAKMPPCPAVEAIPALSPAFSNDWPVPRLGGNMTWVWRGGFNGAVVRHRGGLVLAFRKGRYLAVVDLDDSYVPRTELTLFGGQHEQLPGGLAALEDPRLFIHHDQLYLLAFGLNMTGGWHGLPWLAQLERLPAANHSKTSAGQAAVANFRLIQPRQVFGPEEVPAELNLPPDMDIRNPQREKNWVPFSYNDSIHLLYSLNPPVVLRILADHADAVIEQGIRTEFVSAGNTTVRWRYKVMRGGTPAVFDKAVGGYITFFHSHVRYAVQRTSNGSETLTICPGLNPSASKCGRETQMLYYMGACVLAAQPPFSIQSISETPIVGPDFYKEFHYVSERSGDRLSSAWPAGLMVLPDAFLVSYGVNDESMRMVRLDRRELMQTLRPPLPEDWRGPPC